MGECTAGVLEGGLDLVRGGHSSSHRRCRMMVTLEKTGQKTEGKRATHSLERAEGLVRTVKGC